MFFLISLGTCLFEAPLQFSAISLTHLVYAYIFRLLAEHLFETVSFVINSRKSVSYLAKITLFLFIYYK